jgi:hypothetical protein
MVHTKVVGQSAGTGATVAAAHYVTPERLDATKTRAHLDIRPA